MRSLELGRCCSAIQSQASDGRADVDPTVSRSEPAIARPANAVSTRVRAKRQQSYETLCRAERSDRKRCPASEARAEVRILTSRQRLVRSTGSSLESRCRRATYKTASPAKGA